MFFFGSSSQNNKSGNQSSNLNAGAPVTPVIPPSPATPRSTLPQVTTFKPLAGWAPGILSMSGSTAAVPAAPLKPTMVIQTSPSKNSMASTNAPSPITPINSNPTFAPALRTSQGSLSQPSPTNKAQAQPAPALRTSQGSQSQLKVQPQPKPQLRPQGQVKQAPKPVTPTNRASRSAGLFHGMQFNDPNDFLAQGFLDERRRTNLWATTVTEMGPRPTAYAPQPKASLKAFPVPPRKHPLAPKEPKVAKAPKAKAGIVVNRPAKNGFKAVRKDTKKAAKTSTKKGTKVVKNAYHYVRPAPRPELFSGPMNGPFSASYYKLVNVYIRVPGPFATAGDNEDWIAQGFFDERRRGNMWAHSVIEAFVPKMYQPQRGAWLKACPVPARKHPLEPKEIKAKKASITKQASTAKKASAAKTGAVVKKASVTNASQNKKAQPQAKAQKKPAKKPFNYVRPAPKPLPPGPMNGPFQASYYKLVNVYIRVPGPFAAAGDNEDIIAQGFFDERRRTSTWPYTVPASYVAQMYQPQRGAWLRACPVPARKHPLEPKEIKAKKASITNAGKKARASKKQSLAKKAAPAPAPQKALSVSQTSMTSKAAVQAIAKPQVKQAAAIPKPQQAVQQKQVVQQPKAPAVQQVKPTPKPAAVVAPKAQAQAVVTKSLNKQASKTIKAVGKPAKVTCTAIMVWQPPVRFIPRTMYKEMCKAAQKNLPGLSAPNLKFPQQKEMSTLDRQIAHMKAQKAQAAALKKAAKNKKNSKQIIASPRSARVKCAGPFAAAGDVHASLPIGFFCEWRMTNHWDGFVAEAEAPMRYMPQPNAWLRAAKEIIRPAHLRAPKEKKEKPFVPIKIYIAGPREYSSPRASRCVKSQIDRKLNLVRQRSQEMKRASRDKSVTMTRSRRSVQQPSRRH